MFTMRDSLRPDPHKVIVSHRITRIEDGEAVEYDLAITLRCTGWDDYQRATYWQPAEGGVGDFEIVGVEHDVPACSEKPAPLTEAEMEDVRRWFNSDPDAFREACAEYQSYLDWVGARRGYED